MADLKNILGGSWSPPAQVNSDPPEVQLADAMRSAGLTPPDHIQLDGKLHRFRSGTKGSPGKGDKPGWYIVFGDGVPAGRFGCWRAGIEVTFRADIGRQLTDAEQIANARRLAEAIKLRDAELKRQRETAADTVEVIWNNAAFAEEDHPYLSRKKIGTHGARVTGDGRLIVPLYNNDGGISSLQYIDAEGGKLYHAGGQTGGCYWMIGTLDDPGVLYVAEGFATAATIHEVTNRPCIVAYSASNLVPVTGTLRDTLGTGQEIVIVADNDASGTGQKYADQAAAKYGAKAITIPTEGDANDYVVAGHDLKILLQPQVTDWLVKADDFCTTPSPIKWLVKHWLQESALIMVHGPSGGGKTFAVLDWCLHIASGRPDWNGHKVKDGSVVYLAGEGHHGLKSRIAAWKQTHGVEETNLWLSKGGTDLNTPEGYWRVVEAIRGIGDRPSLIVIDTLHRFLSGDENSAQDAKTMIDACANLMNEFGCSVLLVHHTGVSEEAQHRARGSSAWKGALEIEISVVPAKGDGPIQLVQRKSKDSEEAKPVFAKLELVPINGWLDEDGEQVTSAVMVKSEEPVKEKESKHTESMRLLDKAFWKTKAEMRDGDPYISKSGMISFMIESLGWKERIVKNKIDPTNEGGFILPLLSANIIEPFEHGWKIVDPVFAGTLRIKKNALNNP